MVVATVVVAVDVGVDVVVGVVAVVLVVVAVVEVLVDAVVAGLILEEDVDVIAVTDSEETELPENVAEVRSMKFSGDVIRAKIVTNRS